MSRLVLKSEAVMEILNREIPKLFSDEGNKKYATDDIELSFQDENGNDAWVADWHLEIVERR